jgi:hypothetical protein
MVISLTSRPCRYRLWLARGVEVILPRFYKYRVGDVVHNVLSEGELAEGCNTVEWGGEIKRPETLVKILAERGGCVTLKARLERILVFDY